jgi:hypothetical protein
MLEKAVLDMLDATILLFYLL